MQGIGSGARFTQHVGRKAQGAALRILKDHVAVAG